MQQYILREPYVYLSANELCRSTEQTGASKQQFLPAVLSPSLHRPFGTHCRTMSSTRDILATFKKVTENSSF